MAGATITIEPKLDRGYSKENDGAKTVKASIIKVDMGEMELAKVKFSNQDLLGVGGLSKGMSKSILKNPSLKVPSRQNSSVKRQGS